MSDSERTIKDAEVARKKLASHSSNVGYLFQSTRVRRSIRFRDEINRIILDNRSNLLLRVCPILWFVFFISSKKKRLN
jgi:hypothetical protein